MDDASSDTSVEMLESYRTHPKVTSLIFNRENSGSPFAQWKKGIDIAKGEYIWIAESDDYCETSFLQSLIDTFKTKTVLAYSASMRVNSNSEKIGQHNWTSALDKTKWLKAYTNTGNDEIENYLRFRNTITNASSVIVRTSIFKKIDLPIHMHYCGDWKIWIDILGYGDISYIPECLNYFRTHKKTTRSIKDFKKERKRYKEYFNIIKSNSNFITRLLNLNKYDWILREWSRRKDNYAVDAYKKLGWPLEFIIRYRLKFK